MPDAAGERDQLFADFDLHGYVGIRVLGNADDFERVERQLGPLRRPLERDPDVTVEFVDRIELDGSVTYAGWEEAGFDASGFYVLRGKNNRHGKARIPFEDVGAACHVICERSLAGVPLLLAIVNMTALAKGVLPLHASAFTYGGRGILATGWAKGGKTETLLAFMSRGGRYIGDEWVYLAPDGTMFGLPEPIRLWRWHLAQLPAFAARLRRSERLRLAALDTVATGVERLASVAGSLGSAGSVLRRAAPVLRRQVSVQIPPARLFGQDAIALAGSLDWLVLMASHQAAGVTVERIDALEVGRRMLASNEEEREPLMRYYRQFRFAFPGLRSPTVEHAAQIERELIERVLAGVPAVWIRHPYPVDTAALYESLNRAIATGQGEG